MITKCVFCDKDFGTNWVDTSTDRSGSLVSVRCHCRDYDYVVLSAIHGFDGVYHNYILHCVINGGIKAQYFF